MEPKPQKSQKKTDLGLYLRLLETRRIEPNFWTSEEYLRRAGAELFSNPCQILLDDVLAFPPIHEQGGPLFIYKGGPLKIWSDFSSTDITGMNKEFLDYEFLYDPKEFTQMKGPQWRLFRKNYRKYPTRSPGSLYRTLEQHPGSLEDPVKDLLVKWAGVRDEEEEIHDSGLLVDFVLYGENRGILWDSDGKIIGVNVWDENYRYINYRYVICDPDIPFLDSYMRWLFYTNPETLSKNKLVNDGGCLDSPGLYTFKKRLNPVRIRCVYSWSKT